MFSSSAHTGLLWALECLAWKPEYLNRVVPLLAKLARLDPGGRLTNRPGNSLTEILLIWYPGTAATIGQRLRAVNLVRKREPSISWSLMLRLIPTGHGIASPTHAPIWRDWKPEKERVVTYGEIGKAIGFLVESLLDDVGTSSSRWMDLFDKIHDLPEESRQRIAAKFHEIQPEELGSTSRVEFVTNLRRLVATHRGSRNADWTLPSQEVEQFETLIPRFEPSSPSAKHKWLFLHRALRSFSGSDFSERDAALRNARALAIQEILGELRIGGVMKWSGDFEPGASDIHAIGWSLAEIPLEEDDQEMVFNEVSSEYAIRRRIASSYIFRKASKQGEGLVEWAKQIVRDHSWHAVHQGAFLSSLPSVPGIWDIAEELGDETDREYWRLFQFYGIPRRGDALIRAGRKLLEHDRPHTAVDLLDTYADDMPPSGPPPELIAESLERAIRTPLDGPIDSLYSYHVECHLDRLTQAKFDERRLAALEWAYFPMFGYRRRRSSVLYRVLATEPSFFVDLVCLVFRARGEEPRELPKEEKFRAQMAYRLLSSWELIPGTQEDGKVSGEIFREWISEARESLSERGRREVGDHLIGSVLSHAPVGKDNQWPDEEVRDTIESLESEDIESGFEMAVRNNRGATTRTLIEGGQQERELAERYRRLSESMMDEWPRTSAILRRIAESYERDAQIWDIEAEQTEDDWR